MYLKRLTENNTNGPEATQLQKHLTHVSESYKNVRANLMFALANKKTETAKIIMVTSAEQSDGKTTTCLNLAAAFADTGAKVLIVDADLRRPRMERFICEGKKRKGLSDVLGGFNTLEEVIERPADTNFDCLFSGSIPPNPSELLMMEIVGEVFKTLEKDYDYIFVDTPPVGIVSETLFLTQFATGVLVVARKRKTHIKKVNDMVVALNFAKANILGFVLNSSVDSIARAYYRSRNRYYYYYQ